MTTHLTIDDSPALHSSDRPAKLARLRRILTENDAQTLLITSPEMLTWLLDGSRVQVSVTGTPIMAIAVSHDAEYGVCLSNELDRMADEQLPADVDLRPIPWHANLTDPLPSHDGRLVLHEADVATQLRQARASLLPLELERYRQLCIDSATITTDVLFDATPEQEERSITAELSRRLIEIGADPTVLLAGGARRLGYRHPLATNEPIGERLIAVICARRHGMIANLTRWKYFNPPTTSLSQHNEQLLEVEADTLRATMPGATLSTIFATIKASYVAHGFASDEWERHHQGGPTGYYGRDPRANDTTHEVVAANQAFAWNLSAAGVKVEDTMITSANGHIEPLTVDHRWPTVEVHGLARPAPLVVE